MVRSSLVPFFGAIMPDNAEYLGDGVYATFDGYMIWLDLRGQDSTTRIALEPPVLKALIDYRDRVFAQAEAERSKET